MLLGQTAKLFNENDDCKLRFGLTMRVKKNNYFVLWSFDDDKFP